MIRSETLTRFGQSWETPTPDEVREIAQRLGWSGARCAAHVGVDSRAWRRWTGGERRISYAAWRLLVEAAGMASHD